jgi:FKBP-type peptidyl-prolyl cis-trans isomerase FklB
MKMKLVVAAVLSAAMSTAIAEAVKLNSDMDNVSYSIGVDLGKNFKKQAIEISGPALTQGLQDAMSGDKFLLTEDQMKESLNKFQKELMTKRNAEFAKKSDENKTRGEAFLNANKTKEGVVTLPDGLQYKIVEKGQGAKPGKDDEVTVEYTGSLIDGKVFDSTEKAGKPATFKVSQVIPGWTEILQLMPAGSTWEVYIPSSLAYGPRAMGGLIGPNETLVSKIRLISVKKSDS